MPNFIEYLLGTAAEKAARERVEHLKSQPTLNRSDQKELQRQLGIVNGMHRRQGIVGGALLLSVGVAVALEQFATNREIEWTQDDIVGLASSMAFDPRFPELVHAGNVLLANQQGNNAISSESSLFTDQRIRIKTIPRDEIESTGGIKRGLLASTMPVNGPNVAVVAEQKTGDKVTVRGGSSFTLDTILITRRLMARRSDIAFSLWVAKEMYNVNSTDEVTAMIVDSVYKASEDALQTKTLRINSLRAATEDGVPVEAVIDMMAHFYLLPDYNYAKDLGLLTADDIKQLNIFDFMTNVFQQSDFLKMDNDGRYTWVGDPQTVKQAWVTAASSLDLYKYLSQ